MKRINESKHESQIQRHGRRPVPSGENRKPTYSWIPEDPPFTLPNKPGASHPKTERLSQGASFLLTRLSPGHMRFNADPWTARPPSAWRRHELLACPLTPTARAPHLSLQTVLDKLCALIVIQISLQRNLLKQHRFSQRRRWTEHRGAERLGWRTGKSGGQGEKPRSLGGTRPSEIVVLDWTPPECWRKCPAPKTAALFSQFTGKAS